MDKLLSDPVSVTAWVVILFLIIKDIYFWVKNKGIPSFEEMQIKINTVLIRLEMLENYIKANKLQADKILEQIENNAEIIEKLSKMIIDLHNWHSVTNEDGVRIWYIRPSLEKVLESLKNAIDLQTNLTKELVLELKNNSGTLYRIENRM